MNQGSKYKISKQNWPIDELYYCKKCASLKCKQCTTEENSCYYCPNCLFEVPSATVKAEQGRQVSIKSRCARNCFECLECQSTLVVLQEQDYYYLFCGFCHWNSRLLQLKFDRPTGICQQVQQICKQPPDLIEYENLKSFYEKQLKADTFVDYETSLIDQKPVDYLKRISLRQKCIRKCIECNETLVEPEPKASSVTFKTLALPDFIPSIHLVDTINHYSDNSCKSVASESFKNGFIVLRFRNRLADSCKIKLTVAQTEYITFSCQNFTFSIGSQVENKALKKNIQQSDLKQGFYLVQSQNMVHLGMYCDRKSYASATFQAVINDFSLILTLKV